MSDNYEEEQEKELAITLILDVIEETMEEYALKKAPVDGSLPNCLDAYTKEKLLRLGKANGLEVKSNWLKTELVLFISDAIMDSIVERFLILGKRKLYLLQAMADGKFRMELTLEEVEFFLTVYSAAVKMGLLYSAVEDDEVVTTMPNLVKKKLDTALVHFDEMKKNYASEIEIWEQLNEVLIAGVNLYGILSVGRVIDLWEICFPDSERTIDAVIEFISYSHHILPLIAHGNGFTVVNGHLIGHPIFNSVDNVEAVYSSRLVKLGYNYYEPTKQEIKYYAKHPFERRSLPYKRMKRFVYKVSDDTEEVMEAIELGITTGDDFEALISDLIEEGLLAFQTEEQLEKFMTLLLKLHNNSRLWENGGYTPIEMVDRFVD